MQRCTINTWQDNGDPFLCYSPRFSFTLTHTHTHTHTQWDTHYTHHSHKNNLLAYTLYFPTYTHTHTHTHTVTRHGTQWHTQNKPTIDRTRTTANTKHANYKLIKTTRGNHRSDIAIVYMYPANKFSKPRRHKINITTHSDTHTHTHTHTHTPILHLLFGHG